MRLAYHVVARIYCARLGFVRTYLSLLSKIHPLPSLFQNELRGRGSGPTIMITSTTHSAFELNPLHFFRSLFTGKLIAYLRYKGIPHHWNRCDLATMLEIKRRTGEQVVPVLVHVPSNTWMQDTKFIMDHLECHNRFPARPLLPPATLPVMRILASIMEAWGDEFWIPAAMYSRWHFPENFETLFAPEAGRHLAPDAPADQQRLMAETAAQNMRRFLPALGVTTAQASIMHAWISDTLDELEHHFASCPYVLGTRPTLADFGLIGPLWPHIGRDPHSVRTWIEPRPQVRAWIQRMIQEHSPTTSLHSEVDCLGATPPVSLQPIIARIMREFVPMVVASARNVTTFVTSQPADALKRPLPRMLGTVTYPFGRGTYTRGGNTYQLWMVQRTRDLYAALSTESTIDSFVTIQLTAVTCMYVCMYACMYVCMYVCMHVCMYVCMYACMYACMHSCVCVRVFVCVIRSSHGARLVT
jgi:glutathione S-transferase